MSKRYPGGFIMKNPTAPTGGEYGTAPGVWTLEQVMNYQRAGTWPSPVTPKMLWSWGLNTNGQLGINSTYTQSFVSQVGADQNWKNIAQGSFASLAVKADGTLWSWGLNDAGQLGQNDLIRRSSPTQIGALTTWSFVGGSSTGSFAIKSDGTLWAWGNNYFGQLGQNNTVYTSSPVQVGALTTWSKVYGSGAQSVFAIKTDGTLWACGKNSDGNLGIGNTTNKSSPTQVGALTNWSKISAGYDFTTAVKTDGSIWSWGKNGNGQLGQNVSYSTTRNSPVQIGALTTWSGTASYGSGANIAVKTDGTLWSWGRNNAGQLGQNDTVNRSSPVQVGALSNWSSVGNHNQTSMAINSSGQLWMWGGASNGRIADGSNVTKSSPVQVASNISWTKVGLGGSQASFTLATGKPLSLELWGWGAGTNIGDNTTAKRSSPVQVGSDITWIQASCATSTIAIKSNNTLWGWGFNNGGQIGDGTTTNRSSPVQIGSLTNWKQASSSGGQSSFAVKTDGTLWAWGVGSRGQLGNNSTANISSPVQIGALTDWSNVSAGNSHVLAVKTNNTLWAWGSNNYGQLGQNNLIYRSSPVQVGALTTWRQASAWNDFCLATKTDGTLWSWGANLRGQLGQNSTTYLSSPVQVGALTDWGTIQAGGSMGLAIKTNGTLWSWGFNTSGQLGDGTVVSKSSPIQIGALTTWSKLGAISSTSFAIKTDGSLWGWGYNDVGQLGNDSIASISSPTQIGSSSSWWFVSSGNGDTTLALKQNSSIQPAITSQPTGGSVAEGNSFTLSVTATGAWGYQWYFAGAPIAGATSSSYTITSAVSANSGDYYVVVYNGNGSVTSNTVSLTVTVISGTMFSWGRNNQGALGIGNTNNQSSPVQVGALNTWTKIASGRANSIAIKTNGTMWSWGWNGAGQLGIGNTTSYSSPKQIGALTTWSKTSCGTTFAFAIKTDGTLWSWGENGSGQLGNNARGISIYSPIQIGSGTTWSSVSSGTNQAFALKTDGTLWAWGDNSGGALGDGTVVARSSPVQIGSDTNWSKIFGGSGRCFAIKTDGSLWAWGYGSTGATGFGNTANKSSPTQVGTLTDWAFVAAGNNDTTIAVKTDGTLWSWGYNFNGNLGLNNRTNYSSPKQVGALTTWSKAATGYGAPVAAIKTDGTLWAWGFGGLGSLDNNSTINRSSPVQIGSDTNWGVLPVSGCMAESFTVIKTS